MLRSLYSGVSGMRSFQTKMDVIANNVANVNTTGFKSSRAKFQDMLSQTVANAQAPTRDGIGGVNAQQVGLGVKVGSIDTIMTGGPLQPTSRELDFAIEGEGFFTLSPDVDGKKQVYTRDGAFFLDHEGNLVNSSGLRVLGVQLKNPKKVEGKDPFKDVEIKDAKDLEALTIPKDLGKGKDKLEDFSIDGTGTIIGVYSDGSAYVIGRLGVTKFENPEGLKKDSNNNYVDTNNSGEPETGNAGEGGFGYIRQGFLEMSNVDLANEFTDMIVTSRAYQANSRSITTSDEMLQELLNLKR